ncbi:hypothetical protein, partial [Sphingobium sp.]|uniref:hypothetical protein n=1 Tax=Sphingobium sp. TaxID=1912891 RepID=UPI003B3B6D29
KAPVEIPGLFASDQHQITDKNTAPDAANPNRQSQQYPATQKSARQHNLRFCPVVDFSVTDAGKIAPRLGVGTGLRTVACTACRL